jgi:hypothetical protein
MPVGEAFVDGNISDNLSARGCNQAWVGADLIVVDRDPTLISKTYATSCSFSTTARCHQSSPSLNPILVVVLSENS